MAAVAASNRRRPELAGGRSCVPTDPTPHCRFPIYDCQNSPRPDATIAPMRQPWWDRAGAPIQCPWPISPRTRVLKKSSSSATEAHHADTFWWQRCPPSDLRDDVCIDEVAHRSTSRPKSRSRLRSIPSSGAAASRAFASETSSAAGAPAWTSMTTIPVFCPV